MAEVRVEPYTSLRCLYPRLCHCRRSMQHDEISDGAPDMSSRCNTVALKPRDELEGNKVPRGPSRFRTIKWDSIVAGKILGGPSIDLKCGTAANSANISLEEKAFVKETLVKSKSLDRTRLYVEAA